MDLTRLRQLFIGGAGLGRAIFALLAVGFLALAAANVSTLVLIDSTEKSNDRIEHTYEVREALQDILASGLDAENGQRGYLITGNVAYLSVADTAMARLPGLMDEARALTSDNPSQQERLNALERNLEARFDLLRRTLDLYRAGRRDEAYALLQSGQGLALMTEARAEIRAMNREEGALLRARSARASASARSAAMANIIGGVLILATAIASIALFLRTLREVRRSRDELDELNSSLEQTVAERTGDLKRANEEIQRFAYIVSHDLRAPLVNVMGYTSELQAAAKAIERQIDVIEAKSPKLADAEAISAVREDVPEAIGFIRTSTAKMDSLINAILRLSREGRRNLAPEQIDMNKALKAMADSVSHQVNEAGATIKVAPMPSIVSDRVGIEQVFGNLIDNAVKYLAKDRPGEISIWGRDLGTGYVEYGVADNGRGVAPRDHERIFELFRRAGVQDRTGEGLGLAFVKNTVIRLGGHITLESELGKGSTFKVRLPKRLFVETGEAA